MVQKDNASRKENFECDAKHVISKPEKNKPIMDTTTL